MREQTKACKAKFHADAGEDSSCAALLQGAEGVLMRAASLGLQLRLVDLLVSLGKRARDVIGGLFGSQFALGHGPEFVQTALRRLSAFNDGHSTAVTPVTARISSAFGCRIKGASGGASCEVFFGNRGAIEVLAQEGGPLFEAQQAQHGAPLKFRLSSVEFDQPGKLTVCIAMANDSRRKFTLRMAGSDAHRARLHLMGKKSRLPRCAKIGVNRQIIGSVAARGRGDLIFAPAESNTPEALRKPPQQKKEAVKAKKKKKKAKKAGNKAAVARLASARAPRRGPFRRGSHLPPLPLPLSLGARGGGRRRDRRRPRPPRCGVQTRISPCPP